MKESRTRFTAISRQVSMGRIAAGDHSNALRMRGIIGYGGLVPRDSNSRNSWSTNKLPGCSLGELKLFSGIIIIRARIGYSRALYYVDDDLYTIVMRTTHVPITPRRASN